MANNVLTALRHCPQLHGNLKFTALEIGHRMNRSGYVHMAHQMMAWKTGYSLRTAYRHEAKLCAMGIFQKTVYRTANGYGWNLYKCLLPLPAFYRAAPTTTHNDRVSGTLPDPGREKDTALRAEIANKRQMLQRLTEDSQLWRWTQEDMQALEAILHQTRGTV